MTFKDKLAKNPEHIMIQTVLRLINKEQLMSGKKSLKRNCTTESEGKEWLKDPLRIKPIVYKLTK